MRKAFILLLLIIGGCMTQAPFIPARYHLGVPEADATVLIGESAAQKQAADGNTYTIEWYAMTNYAGLETNIWPQFRMHLDLSLDGGATWSRRIGYGVQTVKGSLGSEFVWSPPDDYSLLTTNARLRAVDLNGNTFRGNTSLPAPVSTNGILSVPFSICGAIVDAPEAGATIYPDIPFTITWRQVGGGDRADIYWVSPATNGLITQVSNVVNGVNSKSINLPVDLPVVPQLKICVRGAQYPSIVGYSGIVEVQP